ncbi:MAG: amino acid-binding protein [Methanobacterium sp.]|uniref:amino acid-binding protein n=1 Tax=Methanobacterium sp. TaxID=2164 RepID=UPI003C779459
MRLNLVLELLDVPGQLLDALDPIGKLGANIVAVIHQRDVKTERGTIPVHISVEGDRETLKRVLKSIEEMDIQIIEVDGVVKKEKITTILIGNIIDKDLKETIKVLNSIKGVRVADLNLKMSDNPEESASRIVIEADYGIKNELMRNINEYGKSKGFLVINEI